MSGDCHLGIGDEFAGGGATPSAVPPVLADLVRADERISFLYFERCIVNQAENAITITDDEGTIRIPVGNTWCADTGAGNHHLP